MIDGETTDEAGEINQPATSINQWHIHFANGETFNLHFRYNCSTLTNDELLEQYHQVEMRCKMANFQVLGITSDDGSINSRLCRLLHRDITPPEGTSIESNNINCIKENTQTTPKKKKKKKKK